MIRKVFIFLLNTCILILNPRLLTAEESVYPPNTSSWQICTYYNSIDKFSWGITVHPRNFNVFKSVDFSQIAISYLHNNTREIKSESGLGNNLNISIGGHALRVMLMGEPFPISEQSFILMEAGPGKSWAHYSVDIGLENPVDFDVNNWELIGGMRAITESSGFYGFHLGLIFKSEINDITLEDPRAGLFYQFSAGWHLDL